MSVTRLTGLSTGLDTDTLVKDLMKIEKMKIDNKVKEQDRVEWQQEMYRDIITDLRDFQSTYFDLLNPETNMTSGSAFSAFSESVQVSGTDVSYLSVKGTSSLSDFSHTVESISQLATADTYETTARGISSITSGTLFGSAIPSPTMEFSMSIDGTAKTISISTGAVTTVDELRDALNTEIQTQFGSDYSNVVTSDNVNDTISFSQAGSDVTILETSGHESDLTWLGITSGDSSAAYGSKTINDLLGIEDADLTTMTINGKSLSDLGVTQSSTLSQLSNAISSSTDMNVSFNYNSASDTFNLSADDTGTANTITMSTDFQNAFGFDGTATHTAAQNAILSIDGTTVVKASNNFTIDGLEYELKATYTDPTPIDISVSKDTEAIKGTITKFVNAYNELIEDINGKLNEKRDYDYDPLTDDEREAMSEDEIEKWEEKAKQGLLRGDIALETLLSNMRSALYESVDGVGINLFDIGIETSSNYKDAGKLVINETELEDAINNNYEQVVDLFTSQSDKAYLDADNSSERYSENGLANRLNDFINDAVRNRRDSNGNKGSLVEKAGVDGESSQVDNTLSEQILDYKTRIANLWSDYYVKEENYYLQFARLETAMQQLNQQGSSLFAQLG